jgi:hypothetical protein
MDNTILKEIFLLPTHHFYSKPTNYFYIKFSGTGSSLQFLEIAYFHPAVMGIMGKVTLIG